MFQNETQNLVESMHFLKILKYSWKVNTKNVMYWKKYMYC
jgi:hypothetical protein